MAARSPQTAASDILGPLTESQLEAVQHIRGPLLILAGPGSGKTRVITHRIAYLIDQGIPPERILALTFTNKAAEEMQSRLDRLAPDQPVQMGTFHRFCAQLLRKYASLIGLQENFSIYDTADRLAVVRDAIAAADVSLVNTSPERIANAIGWAKSDLVTPDEFVARPGHDVGWLVQQVYPAYQKLLLQENAVDFDDLLLHVGVMLRENESLRQSLDERFEYILVDEYQDTNLAQYMIARGLSRDHPNLAVAGDPDQAIYGWRGANLTNILEFERSFDGVHTVRLQQNFRSTPNILRAADQLITNNLRRKQKSLIAERAEGSAVKIVQYRSGREEAFGIARQIYEQSVVGNRPLNDIAIFYRINALSRQLENALRQFQIPFQIVRGLEFYQRKEVKDVLAYLHLINNPNNSVALRRIINVPPRKIGKQTVQRLMDHAQLCQTPMLDAARDVKRIDAIGKASATAVRRFVDLLELLRGEATSSVEQLIRIVLKHSGYFDWLNNSESPEDRDRMDNVNELIADANEFDAQHQHEAGLEQYLEERSLVADSDDWDPQMDRVTLMTLHAAKGLEFPVVYIIGLEEGLLPHGRRNDSSNDVEEERRLLFVGITRAEDKLQLSHADSRFVQGRQIRTVPSPFLLELPRHEGMVEYDSLNPAVRGLPRQADRPDFRPSAADEEYLQDDPDHVSFDTHEPDIQAELRAGMVVQHSEYGQGTIVEVSGQGRNRSATVQFFSDADARTFRLHHVRLEPIHSTD